MDHDSVPQRMNHMEPESQPHMIGFESISAAELFIQQDEIQHVLTSNVL